MNNAHQKQRNTAHTSSSMGNSNSGEDDLEGNEEEEQNQVILQPIEFEEEEETPQERWQGRYPLHYKVAIGVDHGVAELEEFEVCFFLFIQKR